MRSLLLVFTYISASCLHVQAAVAGMVTAASKRKPAQVFRLDCGVYRAVGQLGLNSNQQFVLTLHGGTPVRTELLVVGGGVDEKLKLRDQLVELDLYVPRQIEATAGVNVVFARSVAISRIPETQNGPSLVRSENCGLDE
jgi:hypothetical protein